MSKQTFEPKSEKEKKILEIVGQKIWDMANMPDLPAKMPDVVNQIGKESIAFFVRMSRKEERRQREKISELEQMLKSLTLENIDKARKRILFIDGKNLLSEISEYFGDQYDIKDTSIYPVLFHVLGNAKDTIFAHCSYCKYWDGKRVPYCYWRSVFSKNKKLDLYSSPCFILNVPSKDLKEKRGEMKLEIEKRIKYLKKLRKAVSFLLKIKSRAKPKPCLIGTRPSDYLLPGDRVLVFNWSSAFIDCSRWSSAEGYFFSEKSLWLPGTFLDLNDGKTSKIFLDYPSIHNNSRKEYAHNDLWRWEWEGYPFGAFVIKKWEFNYLVRAKKDDPKFLKLWVQSAVDANWGYSDDNHYDPLTNSRYGKIPAAEYYVEGLDRKNIKKHSGPKLISFKTALKVLGLTRLPSSFEIILEAYKKEQEKMVHEEGQLLQARDMLILRFLAVNKLS